MNNGAAKDGKEKAQREIAKLVEKYKALPATSKKKYTEADTKTKFIERLFTALGWDIYGGEEVTQEQKASRGRVDYAFRIGGIPKFFLEAKPLKADLDNPDYAGQVINYAWHKDVTWAVLTDFESLKVFNAEWKEPIVSRSQFFELKCEEYLDRFDWLWLLSRLACEQNLLDKKALDLFKKTKKTPVGQQLFSDLISWRGLLAKHLSAYNKKYPAYLIDEAVQRILDRLIFIRTCEDRGIEAPILRPHLREWQNGARKNLIREIRNIWRDFDEGYDSRLFQPHLADKLDCEPSPFEEVITGLYSTKDGSIQYDFNAIGADVLGGIYEQYLEYLIRKKGKEVEVIPGKGKRKAQGIYYTPKFIVRYIVENTLGPALTGKPLSEARRIRILDPACGSGSFLVEALDYLEKYWRQQKWVPQSKVREDNYQTDFFDYTTKIQFLSQNIHGVDLDEQAVEIAQLNILLKALSQRERLPNLVNKIHEGNSLISGTEDELKRYFGKNWIDKKPFIWEHQFEDVMREDGFNVIIGNPPYVFTRGRHFNEQDKQYFKTYKSGETGKLNLFSLFVERGIQLLRQGGILGFIVPNNILRVTTYEPIRRLILDSCKILMIVDLSSGIFSNVTAATIIMILQRSSNAIERDHNKTIVITEISDLISGDYHTETIAQSNFRLNPSMVFNIRGYSAISKLFEEMSGQSIKFGDITKVIIEGIVTPRGKKEFVSNNKVNSKWKKFVEGKDIRRYHIDYKGKYINYDRNLLHRPRPESIFNCKEKLICQRVSGGNRVLHFAYDDQQFYTFASTNVVILNENTPYSLKYILGLLNSKLINYYYIFNFSNKSDLTVNISKTYLSQLPIRSIDFNNHVDKKMHDSLVSLVEKMLELNKRMAPIRNIACNEGDELNLQIERIDGEIDNLVYKLYGITEEEKKLIEGN